MNDSENEVDVVEEAWNVRCVRLRFLRNPENARTRSHSFPGSSVSLLANKGPFSTEKTRKLEVFKYAEDYIEVKMVSKTRFNLQEKFFMASQIKNL
jgi:hypothetical protein